MTKNCFWCGHFMQGGKCANCEGYARTLKNNPARIDGFDGRKKKAAGHNQFTGRRTYPEARGKLGEIFRGIRYDNP